MDLNRNNTFQEPDVLSVAHFAQLLASDSMHPQASAAYIPSMQSLRLGLAAPGCDRTCSKKLDHFTLRNSLGTVGASERRFLGARRMCSFVCENSPH